MYSCSVCSSVVFVEGEKVVKNCSCEGTIIAHAEAGLEGTGALNQ